MSVDWSYSGLDVADLFGDIEAYVPLMVDELAGEMAELGAELAARMGMLILAAHTKTGEARVASGRGPHAGRYETGDMYNAVDYRIDVEPEAVILSWGWIQEWEDYFAAQEYGTSQIAAVGALADTFTLSLPRMAAIMDRMVAGR